MLQAFFITETNFSKNAEKIDENQVLAQYPLENVEEKYKLMGNKCSFLIEFINSDIDKYCELESIHANHALILVKKVEPSVLFITVMRNYVNLNSSADKTSVKYISETTYENICRIRLEESYIRFKFYNGSIKTLIEKLGRDEAKNLLQMFFTQHWESNTFSNLSFLDAFQNIRFTEDVINKGNYYNFACRLRCSLNSQLNFVFVKKSKILWTELTMSQTREFYVAVRNDFVPSKANKACTKQSSLLDSFINNPTASNLVNVNFSSDENNFVDSYKLAVVNADQLSVFILWPSEEQVDVDTLIKSVLNPPHSFGCNRISNIEMKLSNLNVEWFFIQNTASGSSEIFTGISDLYGKKSAQSILKKEQELLLKILKFQQSSNEDINHSFVEISPYVCIAIIRHLNMIYALKLAIGFSSLFAFKNKIRNVLRSLTEIGLKDIDVFFSNVE